MNQSTFFEGASWFALLVGLFLLTWVTFGEVAPPSTPARMELSSPVHQLPTELPDMSNPMVITRDLFRLERRPAPVRYDPVRVEQQAAGYSPPRPNLVLRGLIVGDSARAVVEGIPGIEGARMVSAGEMIGGLRIRGISAHSVRVVGFDTTWVLTLPRATP